MADTANKLHQNAVDDHQMLVRFSWAIYYGVRDLHDCSDLNDCSDLLCPVTFHTTLSTLQLGKPRVMSHTCMLIW